jgi:hypothetical protein
MAYATNGGSDFAALARASLARVGLDADETQLAVMAAAEAIFGPRVAQLMEADLAHVPLELDEDLSRAPRG